MEYDKLTEKEVKKLRSIERRLLKISKEIFNMGFNVYLSPGSINIMNGSSHHNDSTQSPARENIRHSVDVMGWDGGDW